MTHLGRVWARLGRPEGHDGVPGTNAFAVGQNPLQADDDEFLLVEKIPLKKAIEMVERGGMPDAKSLAALLLALMMASRSDPEGGTGASLFALDRRCMS